MAKKNIDVTGPGVYRFCAAGGQGIPGLPHEVTAAQAKELGLLEVLQAAIQNGNYRLSPPHPCPSPNGKTPFGEGGKSIPIKPAEETAEN
jgi:hypothetical protein